MSRKTRGDFFEEKNKNTAHLSGSAAWSWGRFRISDTGKHGCIEKLNGPSRLAPPGWVFPVVWTGLFAMMGTASYLIARLPESEEKKKALTLYGIQLAVNFLWPVFFFNAGWYLFSFAWLLLLWYLVYLCTKAFYHLSEKAVP